jgi:hypothetical protein
MRRPNRSIEVFDISLMAVVTKAMGAFLVLMVVFMQYYSSGPLGQNTAQQLTREIEQTQKNTVEALKRLLEKANPEDIAKLLEEARRRLEEARKLIEQLKRENDALNAQAQRLQQANEQLEKEIAELERKLDADRYVLTGTLINWDCLDVKFRLGVVSPSMFIIRENKSEDKYVLNFNPTLGSTSFTDDDDFRKVNPNQQNSPPGVGARFNNASFRYAVNPGVSLGLIVVKQSLQQQRIGNYPGSALQRTKGDCSIYVTVQSALPSKNFLYANFTRRIVIPREAYAQALFDIQIRPQDGAVLLNDPSQPIVAWLSDQIANAAKVSP